MPFKSQLSSIQNGEQVNASVTGRPINEVQGNAQYLKDLYEAAFLGQAIIARDQVVESSVLEGQAVWFNEANARFEAAILDVVTDATTGQLRMSDSSVVWGLVGPKLLPTTADIILAGVVDLDITNALGAGQTAQAGVWFLSGQEPGRLVFSRVPAGVPVCLFAGETATGKRRVYVRPDLRDGLDGHRHYKFELACIPSGDHNPPDIGELHEITNTDADIEGWLPADHASFDGNAPEGAKFGYNIASSAFASLWPPLPLQSAHLEISRGEDENVLGQGVPQGEFQPLVIDKNGIWWMTDCYGQVPWPTWWTNDASESLDTECPFIPPMSATLWFNRPTFLSTQTAVLSLRAKANSGLAVYCADDGSEADTGHLEIDLLLDFDAEGATEPGYVVFKEVEGTTFKRGPVVESVRAGTANVLITSEAALSGTPEGRQVGNLVVSVLDDPNGVELPVGTVRMTRATLEFDLDVPTYGFGAGHISSIRGVIDIPAGLQIPDSGVSMKLTCLLVGRGAGSVPSDVFSASYRRIPFPPSATPLNLPDSDTEITFTAAATLPGTNLYYKAESEAFEVAAGDVVVFSIERNAPDEYSSDLLMLRIRGQLVTNE